MVDINQTRKRLNLSQEDLSKIIGVVYKTIHCWETGKSKPNPYHIGILSIIEKASMLIVEMGSNEDIKYMLASKGPIFTLHVLLARGFFYNKYIKSLKGQP